MDFTIPPHIEKLREQITDVLETKIYPREAAWRKLEEEIFPDCVEDGDEIRSLQKEAQAMGIWAGHLPDEAGGMGLTVLEYGLLNEVIGRSHWAPVFLVVMHLTVATPKFCGTLGQMNRRSAISGLSNEPKCAHFLP